MFTWKKKQIINKQCYFSETVQNKSIGFLLVSLNYITYFRLRRLEYFIKLNLVVTQG